MPELFIVFFIPRYIFFTLLQRSDFISGPPVMFRWPPSSRETWTGRTDGWTTYLEIIPGDFEFQILFAFDFINLFFRSLPLHRFDITGIQGSVDRNRSVQENKSNYWKNQEPKHFWKSGTISDINRSLHMAARGSLSQPRYTVYNIRYIIYVYEDSQSNPFLSLDFISSYFNCISWSCVSRSFTLSLSSVFSILTCSVCSAFAWIVLFIRGELSMPWFKTYSISELLFSVSVRFCISHHFVVEKWKSQFLYFEKKKLEIRVGAKCQKMNKTKVKFKKEILDFSEFEIKIERNRESNMWISTVHVGSLEIIPK